MRKFDNPCRRRANALSKLEYAALAAAAAITLASTPSLANDTEIRVAAGPSRPAPVLSASNGNAQTTVACALPSQIRKLGRTITFLAPSRILRIQRSACADRGGRQLPG